MVVVISGGSSGIGQAVATRLSGHGHDVYEISRSGQSHEGVTHLTGDVCDRASLERAIATIVARTGPIDAVVANAGYGISGPFDTTPEDDLVRQYDVNVLGAARLVSVASPHLTAQARIVFVSSVAAAIAIPYQAHYSATKACLETFARALDNEWRPTKRRALALLLGDIKTNFTANRVKTEGDQRAARSVAKMEHDEIQGTSADVVARRIERLLTATHPKVVSSLGLSYRLVLLAARLLPIRLTNAIVGRLYAR